MARKIQSNIAGKVQSNIFPNEAMLEHDRPTANQLCVRSYPTCTQHGPRRRGVLPLFSKHYLAKEVWNTSTKLVKAFRHQDLQLLATAETPPLPTPFRQGSRTKSMVSHSQIHFVIERACFKTPWLPPPSAHTPEITGSQSFWSIHLLQSICHATMPITLGS